MLKSRVLLVVTLVFFCCVSLGFAADQTRDKDQTKDQKRDGSCVTDVVNSDSWRVIAADQARDKDQTKDQKKDGSCQS
jgi:hypothetical protein